MPTLSRWFLRSGLIFLLLALAIALLRAAQPLLGLPSTLQVLRPTDVHLLVVGWITQLIFGVAYWMFPRPPTGGPRGSERLGWSTFVLINLGLILRLAGEPLYAIGRDVSTLLAVSAACQLAAGWAFVLNTWPRVRGR